MVKPNSLTKRNGHMFDMVGKVSLKKKKTLYNLLNWPPKPLIIPSFEGLNSLAKATLLSKEHYKWIVHFGVGQVPSFAILTASASFRSFVQYWQASINGY